MDEPVIRVIIPSYNCAEWLERTLMSVATQEYPADSVHVIDDASTDSKQWEIIGYHCNLFEWQCTRNETNMRAGYNLFHGIHAMQPEPDDVIFILDGDDFLPHPRVFSRIADIYEDPDAWFVYGQYEPHPHNTGQVPSRPYPPDILARNAFREVEQHCNHPLTFRFFLFDQLSAGDFCDDDGTWFRAGYDRVMFTPLLELAGQAHIRFVDEVLYSYNAVNPISDSYVSLDEARQAHAAVERRPAREPMTRSGA